MWESLRHVKKPSESVGKHKVGFALTVVIFTGFSLVYRTFSSNFHEILQTTLSCLQSSEKFCLLSRPTCYFKSLIM